MARSTNDSSEHRKLALIIGNSNYSRSENRLDYAKNNSRDLSNLLKTIGFNVTLVNDVDKHEMTTHVIDFSKKICDGDLVFFYFCGHGCQVKDENYLIPVGDKQIEKDRDIDDFAYKCERMIERLTEKNRLYVTIAIFDCSKPYLLKSSTSKSHSLIKTKGLNEIKPPPGVFIQFGCAADQMASDNYRINDNNLYGKHLLKNIAQENVDIIDVFQRIMVDVSQESNKSQQPLSMNGLNQHQPVYLNQVIVTVEEWDKINPNDMESVLKTQTALRACYDTFPDIEEVIQRNKENVEKAEKFTQEILSKVPSGNVTERDTACHILHNLLGQENQKCLFFDSSQGMKLHDASGTLADLSVKERPFVLKLNNIDGLGNKTYVNGGEHNLNAIHTLENAVEHNQSHPVIEDIVDRLAKAHNVDKKNIVIKNFYVGSCGIVYLVTDLPDKLVKSLTNVSEKLHKQFEEFKAAKIHPLLYRPAFDIAQFDVRGNKTFTNQELTHQIGPSGRTQLYTPPAGWTRYGLKVLGKFPNDEWLHPFSHAGNWYRAYHGTGRATAADFGNPDKTFSPDYASIDAAASIHENGFRKARVAVHGDGIYCSPNPTFPENGYVSTVKMNTKQGEKSFKCMLQVAVNPDGVKIATNDIWVAQEPKDIRTYGILIKEV
ncbi:unnamed protein product [Adineta steineri]|uniref:Caspase family p20 domain-containing protein n=1 Tax=Adineta steineri TaxID=433720 RepID=A0A815C8J1_9BILA|nr:unnamed protein product [Adineta steineri]CAF1280275.1 unnamed protein product [Adineta steineri]